MQRPCVTPRPRKVVNRSGLTSTTAHERLACEGPPWRLICECPKWLKPGHSDSVLHFKHIHVQPRFEVTQGSPQQHCNLQTASNSGMNTRAPVQPRRTTSTGKRRKVRMRLPACPLKCREKAVFSRQATPSKSGVTSCTLQHGACEYGLWAGCRLLSTAVRCKSLNLECKMAGLEDHYHRT